MKQCGKCRATKPVEEFNKCARNKDGLHNYCRECHKAHYRKNATRHKANVKATKVRYMAEARQLVVDSMADGCVDCGTMDIRVLEFDHVGGKVAGVMAMIRNGRPLNVVRAEIAKCEVRCRNCHAIKTYERLGGTWHDAFVTESGFYPVNRSGVENVGSNPTEGT